MNTFVPGSVIANDHDDYDARFGTSQPSTTVIGFSQGITQQSPRTVTIDHPGRNLKKVRYLDPQTQYEARYGSAHYQTDDEANQRDEQTIAQGRQAAKSMVGGTATRNRITDLQNATPEPTAQSQPEPQTGQVPQELRNRTAGQTATEVIHRIGRLNPESRTGYLEFQPNQAPRKVYTEPAAVNREYRKTNVTTGHAPDVKDQTMLEKAGQFLGRVPFRTETHPEWRPTGRQWPADVAGGAVSRQPLGTEDILPKTTRPNPFSGPVQRSPNPVQRPPTSTISGGNSDLSWAQNLPPQTNVTPTGQVGSLEMAQRRQNNPYR
jgi:hypothetical protein